MTTQTRTMATLFSIALVTRSLFFLWVMPFEPSVQSGLTLQGDARGYHLLARTLADSHQFSFEAGGPPESLRTPAYPLFLSGFYVLFGAKPWIPLMFQLLLDSVSCVLLYAIVRKFAETRIAFCTALLYALDPFLMLHSISLLSEILFIFLLLVGSYFFTIALERDFQPPSARVMGLVGLSLGLATLVRPIALYLGILIPVFCFFLLRHNLKLLVKPILLFAAAFTLTITPWSLRNLQTFNTPSLSTSGAYNLLVLFVSPMEVERRGISSDDEQKALLDEADTLMMRSGSHPSELNEFQRAQYWNALALQYITRFPVPFLKHYCVGITHSFTNLCTREFARMTRLPIEEGEFDIKGHSSYWEAISQFFARKTPAEITIGFTILAFLLIEYACLALGLVVSWRILRKDFLLFCLMVAAYFILLAGPYGLARFRLPALPFYLVFTGIGLNLVSAKLAGRKNTRA